MSIEETAEMLMDTPVAVVNAHLKLLKFPNGDYKVELQPAPIDVDACHVLSVLFGFSAAKNCDQGWDLAVKAITDEIEKMRIMYAVPSKRDQWPGW